MAIIAGKLAAETALEAHSRGDFSDKVMARYEDHLREIFILQDLKQYRNFSKFLETHPEFMATYPAFLNDALGGFFSAYGKPKRQLFQEIFEALTTRRNVFQAAGDFISMGRAVMGW